MRALLSPWLNTEESRHIGSANRYLPLNPEAVDVIVVFGKCMEFPVIPFTPGGAPVEIAK
jgi:hypothetical protein